MIVIAKSKACVQVRPGHVKASSSCITVTTPIRLVEYCCKDHGTAGAKLEVTETETTVLKCCSMENYDEINLDIESQSPSRR